MDMDSGPEYVRLDEHGAMRVGRGRVMLESVLTAWGQGHSPETIRAQYPTLNLEEVYGAIAWSLAHPDELGAYLKRQEAVWEQWRKRAESQVSPLRERLRSAKPRARAS